MREDKKYPADDKMFCRLLESLYSSIYLLKPVSRTIKGSFKFIFINVSLLKFFNIFSGNIKLGNLWVDLSKWKIPKQKNIKKNTAQIILIVFKYHPLLFKDNKNNTLKTIT